MSRYAEIVFERDWDDLRGRLNLGLCCINTELRKKKIFCSRSCIRKNFTVEKAKTLAIQNVKDIVKLIEWNRDNNIRCLRLSSDIFPRFTDPEVEKYTIDFARDELKKAGDLSNKLGHRIVMHPGQYNQVGAQSEEVFKSTVEDLSHHADILDAMGIDDNGVIIVHGGGVYGNKKETIKRWIKQYKTLPDKVKKRLVLENCERQYTTRDCLNISKKCGIPVVLDFHHYECTSLLYPDKKQEYIADMAPEIIKTWGSRRVLMHVSEQGEGRIGHHSDYVEKIPDELLSILEDNPSLVIDLEVEAKMKEQAIMRLYENYPELF